MTLPTSILRPTSLPYGNTTSLPSNVTASWDDAGRTRNTNTPNGATAGVPGFNEYGYVGGLRVWKKITRNGSTFEHRVYVHAGPNLIAEYNAGAAASSPAQEYVYADQIDSLVMIHRSNNQKLGVTRNRQWSVVGLHDLANGNVVERYAYDMTGKRTIYAANGTTVRSTSSFGNNFGYTNRWHDAESGLMYFRARYYNPLTGEFLRRDPLGFEDGMSLYRGYMELGWVDPTGTVKIACGCRARGNKGRQIAAEVECKGSFETCCEEACGKAGRYVWDGQPSRIVHRPEFDATNGAPSIGRSDYTPSYWRDYFLTWRSPHPHDPVDLWLTRGKIGAGGVFVVAGGTVVAIKTGVISAVAHYGRSAYYWAWANSGYAPVAATTGASLANGALGVVDPLPDATDIGMAGKPIREAAEEVFEASDDFIIAGKKWYHGTDLDSAIDMTQNGLSREKWRAHSPIDRNAPGLFVTPKLSDAHSYAIFRGGERGGVIEWDESEIGKWLIGIGRNDEAVIPFDAFNKVPCPRLVGE